MSPTRAVDHASSSVFGINNLQSDDLDETFGEDSDEFQLSKHSASKQPQLHQEYFDDTASERIRNMNYARMIMVIFMVAVGCGLSAGVYLMLTRYETMLCEADHASSMNVIEEAAWKTFGSMEQAIRNIADSITFHARESNSSFPFVTMTLFESFAGNIRLTNNFLTIGYSPIVPIEKRQSWEKYAGEFGKQMIDSQLQQHEPQQLVASMDDHFDVFPSIFETESHGEHLLRTRAKEKSNQPFVPLWQLSPLTIDSSQFLNYNLLHDQWLGEVVLHAVKNGNIVVTDFAGPLFGNTSAESTESYIVAPVFATTDVRPLTKPRVVGFVYGYFTWDEVLSQIARPVGSGAVAMLENTCQSSRTFVSRDDRFFGVRYGDLHDFHHDSMSLRISLTSSDIKRKDGFCFYELVMYANDELEQLVRSNMPWKVTLTIVGVLAASILSFVAYEIYIARQNQVLLSIACKSQAIVANLFPSNVRGRLFAEKDKETTSISRTSQPQSIQTMKAAGFSGVECEVDAGIGYKGRPIADLFTESTVLFADIAGFTAWSSQREPAQVFTLLETLYHAFDNIASRRRVFKVETVGDCYVAATGVPEPQKDHAVIMCRFARDILNKCGALTKCLETTLGPDTGELNLRIGIHSGPVTAGVLRGERSRFQLFGDTMNTASRIESTGKGGKIQLSQETADLVMCSGRSQWLAQREDTVFAKGKGEMTTYWLLINRSDTASSSGESDISQESRPYAVSEEDSPTVAAKLASEKMARLVEWNCEVILRLLKQIRLRKMVPTPPLSGKISEARYLRAGHLPIHDVNEIISLPIFDDKLDCEMDLDRIGLSPATVSQVYDYVSNIAALYRNNHFHSFEHASHVTMSVTKLLSRIIAPLSLRGSGQALHDHTYGVTSDPLTQFACVFSALIHDVDHTGVPNTQLLKEHSQIVDYYQGKSVAEQNSVDIAWHLLMDESYSDFRAAIYSTTEELDRFRALVVNSVMATDIVDKELKLVRNERWDKAFSQRPSHEDVKTANDRKATIVIEHLIQASDVSHTMQHWHIYRKWNERFFFECYQGFCDGRSEDDPSELWYEGELGFYDYYIIPLAMKLKDCGVFGVSSDEYLNYAQRNRVEWQARGQAIVQEMLEKAKKIMFVKNSSASSLEDNLGDRCCDEDAMATMESNEEHSQIRELQEIVSPPLLMKHAEDECLEQLLQRSAHLADTNESIPSLSSSLSNFSNSSAFTRVTPSSGRKEDVLVETREMESKEVNIAQASFTIITEAGDTRPDTQTDEEMVTRFDDLPCPDSASKLWVKDMKSIDTMLFL